MPQFLRKDNPNGGLVAVWHVTEEIDELKDQLSLSDQDIQKLNSFKLDKRKLEFLATRCLIKDILGIEPKIDYLETGRPVLRNSNYSLSISHTQCYVAIALSENQQVGIDIEYPSERVARVYERFISTEECSFIPAENKIEYFTLIWCLKEAMYKLFDEKSVIFNRDLKCMPFVLQDEGIVEALYCLQNDISLQYRYITTNEFYLVYHC
jgi:4'-phosphopantetheinyl transferase EntD